MSKQITKIKVLNGAPELIGKVLNLKEEEEGLYICEATGIEVVDTWGEIASLPEKSKNSIDGVFYDLHLFSLSLGDSLAFIDEVEYLQ